MVRFFKSEALDGRCLVVLLLLAGGESESESGSAESSTLVLRFRVKGTADEAASPGDVEELLSCRASSGEYIIISGGNWGCENFE